MRHLFYILLFAMLLFISCTKNDFGVSNDNNQELMTEIIGEWKWVKTYGTIAGQTWTPTSSGISQSLVFDNMMVAHYRNDTLQSELSYEIFTTDTLISGEEYTYIRYDGNIRRLELSGDSLGLFDLCFDCLDDYYIKE